VIFMPEGLVPGTVRMVRWLRKKSAAKAAAANGGGP